MLGSVFAKNMRDQRRALLLWTLGLFAFVAIECSVYPAVHSSSRFLSLYVNNLPKVIRDAFLGGVDIGSPGGFVNAEIFSFMGPVLFLVYAIGAGARAIGGEEESGTLDLLLSCPVSRRSVLLQKFAVLASGVGVLTLALFVALLVGTRAASMDLGAKTILQGCMLLGLLGLSLGTVAMLTGAAAGRRTYGIAVGGGLSVALYLLNALAQITAGVKPFRVLSLFYYYGGAAPMARGINAANLAVLVVTTLVLLAAALVAFGRRDLR